MRVISVMIHLLKCVASSSSASTHPSGEDEVGMGMGLGGDGDEVGMGWVGMGRGWDGVGMGRGWVAFRSVMLRNITHTRSRECTHMGRLLSTSALGD